MHHFCNLFLEIILKLYFLWKQCPKMIIKIKNLNNSEIESVKNFENLFKKKIGFTLFTEKKIILFLEREEDVKRFPKKIFGKNVMIKSVKGGQKNIIGFILQFLKLKKKKICLLVHFDIVNLLKLYCYKRQFYFRIKSNQLLNNRIESNLDQNQVFMKLKLHHLSHEIIKRVFRSNMDSCIENISNQNTSFFKNLTGGNIILNRNKIMSYKYRIKLLNFGRFDNIVNNFDKKSSNVLLFLLKMKNSKDSIAVRLSRIILLNPSVIQIYFFHFMIFYFRILFKNLEKNIYEKIYSSYYEIINSFVPERLYMKRKAGLEYFFYKKNSIHDAYFLLQNFNNDVSSLDNGIFCHLTRELVIHSPKNSLIYLKNSCNKELKKHVFFLKKNQVIEQIEILRKLRKYKILIKRMKSFKIKSFIKLEKINQKNFFYSKNLFKNLSKVTEKMDLEILDILVKENQYKKAMEIKNMLKSLFLLKIKRIKFLRIGKKLFLALTFFRNNILSVENITFMTGIYLEKIILRIDEVNFNLIKILSKLYKIASKKEFDFKKIKNCLKIKKSANNLPCLENVKSKPKFSIKKNFSKIKLHPSGIDFSDNFQTSRFFLSFRKIKNIHFYHDKKNAIFYLDLKLHKFFIFKSEKYSSIQIFFEIPDKGAKTNEKNKFSKITQEYFDKCVMKLMKKKILLNFNLFIQFLMKVSGKNVYRPNYSFIPGIINDKNNAYLKFFKNSIGSMSIYPSFFITIGQIDFVIFERFFQNAKSFDLVFIFKKKHNISKKWKRLNSIDVSSFIYIEKILKSHQIKYKILSFSINWKKLFEKVKFNNSNGLLPEFNENESNESTENYSGKELSFFSDKSTKNSSIILSEHISFDKKKERLDWSKIVARF
jgi:hypothetical protein